MSVAYLANAAFTMLANAGIELDVSALLPITKWIDPRLVTGAATKLKRTALEETAVKPVEAAFVAVTTHVPIWVDAMTLWLTVQPEPVAANVTLPVPDPPLVVNITFVPTLFDNVALVIRSAACATLFETIGPKFADVAGVVEASVPRSVTVTVMVLPAWCSLVVNVALFAPTVVHDEPLQAFHWYVKVFVPLVQLPVVAVKTLPTRVDPEMVGNNVLTAGPV